MDAKKMQKLPKSFYFIRWIVPGTVLSSTNRGVLMSEEKMIAFCGLTCSECPAFVAKRTDDNELRKKTVEDWSSPEFPLNPEDINCDGCVTGVDVFKHCTMCEVRKCATDKGVKTCAHCAEYSCDTLEGLWELLQVPHAKETLDGIKKL